MGKEGIGEGSENLLRKRKKEKKFTGA